MKIYKSQKEEATETRVSLKSIEKALTGDGESTVLTQMQKLRTTFADKQDELVKSFKEFARKMAENNIKVLIAALKEVIKDFNTKINEQFGENFKQLNESVEKILVWQKQYMEQMDKLAQEFNMAAQSIETSKNSLVIISEQSNIFNKNAEKLKDILTALEEKQNSLEQHLKAFSNLANQAGEAFPIIEKRLDQLTNEFSKYVYEAISASSKSSNELSDSLKEQATQIDSILTNLRNHIESINAQTGQNIDKMFKESSERIEKQLVSLDSELQNELTKSIESLGSQLTSLSRKFVDDYSPLTDKLRDLVQISRSIQNGPNA
jgi:DNA repair exonuclease SbcCD ATPase subunit